MALFQASNGKSRREEVYEEIKDAPSDVLIPYAKLPFEIEILHRLRDKVAKTFEREQQRTVVSIPGEGWMVVRGVEHVAMAERTRRTATRRMGRAKHMIESVDRHEMSAEQRVRFDRELIQIQTVYGVARGMASKRLGIKEIIEWDQQQRGRDAA